MTASLDGRAILVTGGGSGIGRAVVDAYVGAGALVTVLERSASHADELTGRYAGDVTVIRGDATDPDDVAAAVTAASATSRDGHGIDHLTCCVGVFDYYARLHELDADQVVAAGQEIWRLNVLSALLAINRAYDGLRAARGSVTLTLSGAAFHASGGGVLYGSSKWALRGVVAHLAKDLAPDVRVNGVAPGGTDGTRLGGLRALAQDQTADQVPNRAERIRSSTLLQLTPTPVDHAAAYLYLADPIGARVCTGTIISSDGGPL